MDVTEPTPGERLYPAATVDLAAHIVDYVLTASGQTYDPTSLGDRQLITGVAAMIDNGPPPAPPPLTPEDADRIAATLAVALAADSRYTAGRYTAEQWAGPVRYAITAGFTEREILSVANRCPWPSTALAVYEDLTTLRNATPLTQERTR